MLLLDVSNIMYTGASSRAQYFGDASDFKLRSIPYFFQQIASYYGEDKQMIAVFEKVGKIPALASSTGYKSGRPRNPLVEWEITALQKLLELIGFPILQVEGQESDYIINNYCRLNRDRENIAIISADQDLASNVRQGTYSTKMLSYSSVSYNIDKANFKAITGVEYNFMNIHKLLLGCKSDKIKAFPNGKEIYNSYIKNLESIWRRRYNYNVSTNVTSDFSDDILMPYTEYDYFINWYELSRFYEPSMKRQLDERRLLIEGPIFDLPRTYGINWEEYNRLIAAFNMTSNASVKAVKLGKFDDQVYQNVLSILRQTQTANVSMFEGNMQELEELTEVTNIGNIIGLLQAGGEL